MDFSQYEMQGLHDVGAINIFMGNQGRNYKRHWHSYGEIILVGPGDRHIFMVNQNTYDLVSGDFVLVWPREMHEVVDTNLEEALIIQFSNTFMNSLFDLQRIMHFYRNLHVLCVNNHRQLVLQLQEIVHKMRDIFFSDSSDKELRCCMLLMEFMLTLDEHKNEFAPEINSLDNNGYNEDIMRRMISVTDYIKNNLTADDLSQATMAKMAGISKDYFSRLFKTVTGTNYSKWLNMIRMEKATELLSLDNRPLTEVAMLAGFQSIPSFNRVFRAEKGMSPGEYRSLRVKEKEVL
ncbi:AraC-type DNA-binding protein [Pseudobutyrivibrio sp. NOR37]|uniref:AraC family transcriptional regulator n=1 Tax=Pseudobutyrivibrio xylanivorans TaxID=185007 RepID=A0A6M0LKV4_PSEXY|nr:MULTISPECIES: helix-turn-helix domain-containing protein [Pseudobutyrivibrio]NEX01511.1 AraC family transcriptional regulator [Pseudobutyrivibrio xylanivorans]SCY34329.1 AraC-type DNA-binding protein [Pseudobutyrivibrio sp. AR14]SFR68033.1 AraC-type DNA-binding protein [Pseudobutyrivibrio sp. NOR37]